MRSIYISRASLPLCACLALVGCDDDPAQPPPAATQDAGNRADSQAPTSTQAMSDASEAAVSLCSKYGGAENVDRVVHEDVLGAIAEDCRINSFFTSLSNAGLTRVGDCLSLQVQELFGCEGVTYAGAKASNGLSCRSMAEAHQGLGISSGDFDALIEDVVAGLTKAGVAAADINAAAPALLGLHDDIVELEVATPTQAMCLPSDAGMTYTDASADAATAMDAATGDAGTPDASVPPTLCEKYGGAGNIASVVQNNVIGAIAEDCRINTFFTTLSSGAFTRVNDCLTIQVQELFGCPGIQYQGARDSNGQACRSMAAAHAGLGISDGDFNALIEDVVAGLSAAGVEAADINAAAPALLGMQPDIVELGGQAGATQAMCTTGDSGVQADSSLQTDSAVQQ